MKIVIGVKEFTEEAIDSIANVHHPISPAEIYSGQPVTATLSDPENGKPIKWVLPVFRLSPLGAEIDITSLNNINYRIGQEVDLQINVAKQRCNFHGITVASLTNDNGHRLIGFRWCQRDQASDVSVEKRKHDRWLCGEHFLPTGIALNPAKFNDYIFFSVVDISRQGMQLTTSLRNKFLVPGMILESSLSLPLIGNTTLHLKIVNARITSTHGKDYLSLGAEILENNEHISKLLGQYLLQFGPSLTIAELRKSGFHIDNAKNQLSFNFVKTAEDYKEILELRKCAFTKAGILDISSPAESLSDMYDTRSRILYTKINNKIVGTVRLSFYALDEKNEYDNYVKFPDNFPRRDEIVVASRACTSPDYEKAGIIYGMTRELILTVLQSRRRYILGCTADELLPLYEKLGFKPLGIYYNHPHFKNIKEQIILGDIFNILTGNSTSIAIWNEIYADLTHYITNIYGISFTPEINFKIKLLKLFSPITHLFTRNMLKAKKSSI